MLNVCACVCVCVCVCLCMCGGFAKAVADVCDYDYQLHWQHFRLGFAVATFTSCGCFDN